MLIFIQVYALSTLVINKEDIYNKDNLEKYDLTERDKNIKKIKLHGYSRKSFENYHIQKRKNIREYMEKQIYLLKEKNNLSRVPESNEKAISNIKNNISSLEQELKVINNNLDELDNNYEPFIYNSNAYYENGKQASSNRNSVDLLLELFNKSNKVALKEYLKVLILDLIDKTYEIEKEYLFAITDFDELITIIRNSFSHIGRIVLQENRFDLVFNDYDDEGIKTGIVMGNVLDLIRLIEFPIPEDDLAKTEMEIKQLRFTKN